MTVQKFPILYIGNKYRETKKHIPNLKIDFSRYKTIIEPFGGSFGFSRYVFYDLGLTNMNYVIYDNDERLITLYTNIQTAILNDTIGDHIKEYNNHMQYLADNHTHNEKKKLLKGVAVREYIQKNDSVFGPICRDIFYYYFKNSHIHVYRFLDSEIGFSELFKRATFVHCKYEDIPMETLQDKNTLVYYDPPYLVSANNKYLTGFSIDTIFRKMFSLFNDSNNQLLVHEQSVFLDLIFKCSTHVYNKTYSITNKRRTNHCIYYTLQKK